MSKQLRHLIQNQPQVKVAAQSHESASLKVWFATLAAFFAGVFYFWGYYFWGNLWRALTGG